MRTRERLVEVLETVGTANGPAVHLVLALAADVISGDGTADGALRSAVQRISERNCSPHIRELASEALHYLEEVKP